MNKPLGILESITPENYIVDQRLRSQMFDGENKQSLNNYLSSHPYQDQMAKHPEFQSFSASNLREVPSFETLLN
jgi:hypothetical protein